jgi:hypothetical protein
MSKLGGWYRRLQARVPDLFSNPPKNILTSSVSAQPKTRKYGSIKAKFILNNRYQKERPGGYLTFGIGRQVKRVRRFFA